MPGPFDCDRCQNGITREGPPAVRLPAASEEARRRAHCGWLDESRWLGDSPDLELDAQGCKRNMVGAKPSAGFDGVEWTGDVCPGWAVRTPLITEIAEAHTALEAGALSEFFPDLTNVMAEGLLEMKRTLAEYERNNMTALKETNRNG